MRSPALGRRPSRSTCCWSIAGDGAATRRWRRRSAGALPCWRQRQSSAAARSGSKPAAYAFRYPEGGSFPAPAAALCRCRGDRRRQRRHRPDRNAALRADDLHRRRPHRSVVPIARRRPVLPARIQGSRPTAYRSAAASLRPISATRCRSPSRAARHHPHDQRRRRPRRPRAREICAAASW